jgi:hypothetical protein
MFKRHAIAVAVVLVAVMTFSSCSLKEYNWWRDQAGLEKIRATDPDAQRHLDVATEIWAAKRAEARRAEQRKATAATSGRIPSILWRIAGCESGNGGRGINYTARNPRSSASGGWQFLSGTWRYVARTYAGTWDALGFGHLRGEALSVSRMSHARPAVQQAAALVLYNREGTRPWLASRRCWQ